MTSSSFCEQCGAANDASARFCAECGAEQQPPVSRHEAQDASFPPITDASIKRDGATAGAAFHASAWGEGMTSALPSLGGLPLELWMVIAAFAIPGAWVLIDVVRVLPDAVRAMGATIFGARIGLALLMILLLVGLVGAAMVAIAWRLQQRDRVGRGLAYAFAGTIVLSVALSNDATTADTFAMVLSLVGIAILAFVPRVRAVFNESASPDAAPTSIVVSRTAIAVFAAIAGVCCVIYLLLASISGKYVVAALIAAAAAVVSIVGSKRIAHADRTARLYVSIGGAAVAILLLALGRSATGLLFPIGVIVVAVVALWLPNDARAFFGDGPLNIGVP